MGEERLFPVLLSLAQRVLKRHAAAVVRDFGIEPFERLLHLCNALGELLPLLDQNGLARTDRSLALLEKGNVLDERFDLESGAAHTFNELDPAAGRFVVVAYAALGAGDRRNETDALVVAQCVSGDVIFLGGFSNRHFLSLL